MPMKYYDEPPKYSENPEEILEGEEFLSHHSYCAVCFEQIYAPILKGIWYHHDKYSNLNHKPIPADTLTLLFLAYKNSNGTLLKITKYDSKKSRACPCYIKWFNLLKKDIKSGFYGEHYYDSDGMTLCKVYLIGIRSESITDPDYPEKQGYNCEKCIAVLEKQKFLKIIQPTGKSKNRIYCKIEWLKK